MTKPDSQSSPATSSDRISRARPGDEILPTRYRKKPVEIEAIRWSGTNLKELIDFTGLHPSADKWTWEEYEAVVREKGLKIFSLEGSNFIVTLGDYIIKGVKGEFYACKPDIFWMTYVRADAAVLSETRESINDRPADLPELAIFWANLPDDATDSLRAAGAKRLALAYLNSESILGAALLRLQKLGDTTFALPARSSIGESAVADYIHRLMHSCPTHPEVVRIACELNALLAPSATAPTTGDTVTVPRDVAKLIRKVFLPINPKKARSYAPETMAAVLAFIAATDGGTTP